MIRHNYFLNLFLLNYHTHTWRPRCSDRREQQLCLRVKSLDNSLINTMASLIVYERGILIVEMCHLGRNKVRGGGCEFDRKKVMDKGDSFRLQAPGYRVLDNRSSAQWPWCVVQDQNKIFFFFCFVFLELFVAKSPAPCSVMAVKFCKT